MRIELCTWKYDKSGNIVHISNSNDVKRIEFLYDKRDNIIWEMFTNVTWNVVKVEWVIIKRCHENPNLEFTVIHRPSKTYKGLSTLTVSGCLKSFFPSLLVCQKGWQEAINFLLWYNLQLYWQQRWCMRTTPLRKEFCLRILITLIKLAFQVWNRILIICQYCCILGKSLI